MTLPDTTDSLTSSMAALGLHPGPGELRQLIASPLGLQVARLLRTLVPPETHNASVFVVPDPKGPNPLQSGSQRSAPQLLVDPGQPAGTS